VLGGRDHERAALDRLREEARDGQSGVLVIRGEAGAGKTALLEHAIESACRRGQGLRSSLWRQRCREKAP
jgi:predicted ATPase